MCIALAAPASAYTNVSSCLNCHSDFLDGSPSAHSLHQDFTNDCRDCHQSSLSTGLQTNNSANYANYSCNGCHLIEGLVTKHVDEGFSTCGCHSDLVGTSGGENVLPYYYQGGRSAIVNTCRLNAAAGGEDWNEDGTGLDNDGDGLYDAADADCEGIVPVSSDDWGTLKTLFGTE